ncbi:MAG: hypothetical protein HIU91_02600 [Acidobacteria bacterium]|nr:hypothetical protein [Acidobacteriota bacterium]
MKPFASHNLRSSALALCITSALLISPSYAQTSPQPTQSAITYCPPGTAKQPTTSRPSNPPACVARPKKPDTSISLGAFPQLTIDRTQDTFGFSMQGTAPSVGTLGTFRQTFSTWLGYSVNLGYTRVSEQYRNPGAYYTYSTDGLFTVQSNMYESTIAYVAHTPINKRFSLFGDIGPGLLTFLPVHRGATAIDYTPYHLAMGVPGVQFRPAGVAGSGFDLTLSRRFALRAEYRGLLYKNPDFQTGYNLYSKQLTLTSEPTLSILYHFYATKP